MKIPDAAAALESGTEAEPLRERLRTIPVPVVVVMGLGEECQEFDLQLGLRKAFRNEGYAVLQYGTKAYTGLFGFEPLPQAPEISLNKRVFAYNGLFVDDCEREKPDVMIIDSPKRRSEFLCDLRRLIMNDGYTCAVITQDGDNKPSDYLFSLKSSPLNVVDTFDFILNACRPGVLLVDACEWKGNADVVVYNSKTEIYGLESQPIRFDVVGVNDVWAKIKALY